MFTYNKHSLKRTHEHERWHVARERCGCFLRNEDEAMPIARIRDLFICFCFRSFSTFINYITGCVCAKKVKRASEKKWSEWKETAQNRFFSVRSVCELVWESKSISAHRKIVPFLPSYLPTYLPSYHPNILATANTHLALFMLRQLKMDSSLRKIKRRDLNT